MSCVLKGLSCLGAPPRWGREAPQLEGGEFRGSDALDSQECGGVETSNDRTQQQRGGLP
jgi:hypothetical protein